MIDSLPLVSKIQILIVVYYSACLLVRRGLKLWLSYEKLIHDRRAGCSDAS